MSPELAGKQYKISVHMLPGEREEEHRRAYSFVNIANSFLMDMRPKMMNNPSGFFIENSSITALANFLSRRNADKFVKALLKGFRPVLRFTRDQDSEVNDHYIIEWISGETVPDSPGSRGY